MEKEQLENPIGSLKYSMFNKFDDLDVGFDKKNHIIENFLENETIQQQHILDKAQKCDDSETQGSIISDDQNKIKRRNFIIHYNKIRIRKSSKDQPSDKRFADTYLTRFKHKIKRKLQTQQSVVDIKELKFLPGMLKQSWGAIVDLLETPNSLSNEFTFKSLSSQYTSSHQILLDYLFPIQNKSGQSQSHKLSKDTLQITSGFFSSYQIMSKCSGLPGINRRDLAFINCRHYNTCTNIKYNNFNQDKQIQKK